MKKLLILSIGILIASCSPLYYSPNTVNAPLFTEKGNYNITVGGNGNQFEILGGIAVTDHLGVVANASFYNPDDLDNGDGGSGKFFEGGIGYYAMLNDRFQFDTYGLVGFGNFENHFPSRTIDNPNTDGKINANVSRFSIQPGIGYITKYFTASLNPRLAYLNYTNIGGSLIYDQIDQQKYLEENKSHFLIEPALTLRGGLEKIKFQFQYGYSLNLTDSNFKGNESWVTLGVNFNLFTKNKSN